MVKGELKLMEELLKEKIEGQSDILEQHKDSVEAVYEAIFKMIEDLGKEDITELKKRGAIAKNGKEINLISHSGSTIIATDGKRTFMMNSERPPEEKENVNNVRDIGIMIDELGKITDLEVAYRGEGIYIAKRLPFSEVAEVATKQAKSIIKEENANIIMKLLYNIKNFSRSKSTKMFNDGKMTENEFLEAFTNLKYSSAQLKRKREKAIKQEKNRKIEEFKEYIRINEKSLDDIEPEEDIELEGNNMNGDIAFFRDTFLTAEKEYLEELKKQPECKKFIKDMNRYDSKKLSLEAVRRVSDIETGRVKEEDLESVEAEITLLLAAIQDCVREKVKERVEKYEEDLEK